MDDDGYPEESELQAIRTWDFKDVRGLFDYIKDRWNWQEWGWTEEPYSEGFDDSPRTRISISTGGWSGNEDVLGALEENRIAWIMTWESSRRGGHYTFTLRDERGRAGEKT